MGRIRLLCISVLLSIIFLTNFILQRHLLKKFGEWTCTEGVKLPEFRDTPTSGGSSRDLHCVPENQWLLWALSLSNFIEEWMEQSSPIALYDVWMTSLITLFILLIPEIIILIKITVAVILYASKYLWKLGYPYLYQRPLLCNRGTNLRDGFSQTPEPFDTSPIIREDDKQVICNNDNVTDPKPSSNSISDSDSDSSGVGDNSSNISSRCNTSSNIINEVNNASISPNFVECSGSDASLGSDSTCTPPCNASEHLINIDHADSVSQISTDHTKSKNNSLLSSQMASICKRGDKVNDNMNGKSTMYTHTSLSKDTSQFRGSAPGNCHSVDSLNIDFGPYTGFSINADSHYTSSITPGSCSESQSFSDEFHVEVDRIVVTSRGQKSQGSYNGTFSTKQVISRSSIAMGDSLEMLVGDLDFNKSESSTCSWEQSSDISQHNAPLLSCSRHANGIVIINSKRDLEVSVASIPSIDISTATAFPALRDTEEYSEEKISSTDSVCHSGPEIELSDSTCSGDTEGTTCSLSSSANDCQIYDPDESDAYKSDDLEYFDQDATGSWTESESITTQITASSSTGDEFLQLIDIALRKSLSVGSHIQTNTAGGSNDQTRSDSEMLNNVHGMSNIPTKSIKSDLSMADTKPDSVTRGKRHNTHRKSQTRSHVSALLENTRSAEPQPKSSNTSNSQHKLAAVDNHLNSGPTSICSERHHSDTTIRLAAVKEKLHKLKQESSKEQQLEPNRNADVECPRPGGLTGKGMEVTKPSMSSMTDNAVECPRPGDLTGKGMEVTKPSMSSMTDNAAYEASETELRSVNADPTSCTSTLRVDVPVVPDLHSTQETNSFLSLPECSSSNASPFTSKLELLGLIGGKMIKSMPATKVSTSATDGQGHERYPIKKRWKSPRLREQPVHHAPTTPIDTTHENTQRALPPVVTPATSEKSPPPQTPPPQTICSEMQSHGDVYKNKPESLIEKKIGGNNSHGISSSENSSFMTADSSYSADRVDDGFPFCTGLLYPSIEERRAVFRRRKPGLSQSETTH